MKRSRPKALPLLLAAVALSAVLGASGQSPIGAAYSELGGKASGLGRPAGAETCGLRDGGCYRNYQFGAILWSPETGAQPSYGAIRAAWAAEGFESGALGYPVDAPACVDETCAQHFELGMITSTAGKGTTVNRAVDDPAATAVVVNKQRPLQPADYVPGDLVPAGTGLLRAEAAASLAGLTEAAAADGVTVTTVSGYRSYENQAVLYAGYTGQYGQETADTISARPGHSEHQTGLALDIGNPGGLCSLQACFEDTPAGAWAAENAHRFGFIIRYPDGASATTGYAYEPWHLRYVGTDLAEGMRDAGVATLEEYLGLPAAAGY